MQIVIFLFILTVMHQPFNYHLFILTVMHQPFNYHAIEISSS